MEPYRTPTKPRSLRLTVKNSQAQLDNLKLSAPYRFNSETGREAGKKGNPNSQEARRRNKTMAQFAKQIAEFRVSSANVIARLVELGITEEEANNAAQIVMGVFDHAIKGDIPAVDKWEQFLARAEVEENGILDTDTRQALAIMRANYLPNISSNFGAISVAALKHRYTHYEASGGRGSLKSSWASLAVVRLLMEYPDTHALVLRKVANTMRDSVFAQYQWAITQLGVSQFWEPRRSPLERCFRPTGQRILFRGADDPMKIKSITITIQLEES